MTDERPRVAIAIPKRGGRQEIPVACEPGGPVVDSEVDRRPLVPRTRRWGIALAAVTAVISGFAVYVNGFGVRAWRDSGASTATYTTFKNLVAAALLLALMALATRRHPGRRALGHDASTAVAGGSSCS